LIQSPPDDLLRLGVVRLDTLVGYVDLHGDQSHRRELGFVIGERGRWGHGLGRSAAAPGLHHGFRQIALREVWAEAMDANQPSVLPVRVGRTQRAGLLVESVDVLDHLSADAVGVGRFESDLDEARTLEHLGGADVVFGDAGEQRPGQLDSNKRVEGGRGKPPTPPGRVDPVGDFSLALHREAPDRSDASAVVLDRKQRAVRVVAYALVVPIERCPVRGVGSREGRQCDSTGISLPLEDPIEIGVLDRPKSEAHAIRM